LAEAERDEPIELNPGGQLRPDVQLDPPARRGLWWLVVPVLLVHLIALYSPGNPSMPEPPYVDKLVHAALFGVPTWLLGRLTRRPWLIASIFAVHAVFSEVVQLLWVPGRDGDVFDTLADLVGIAIALLWVLRTRDDR
jgi:VanZ family protein